MTEDSKARWLNAAEVFDSWRVVPRITLALFGVLVGWATVYLILWYAKLPAVERDAQVTAFMGMIFTTLMGASGFVFKVYTDNGRNWDAPKTSQ